jgi:glutamate carboxypeptidase
MNSQDVLAYLQAQLPQMVDDVRELVAIDSGSYCKEGVDRIGEICARRLADLGFSVKTIKQENFGNHLIARRQGTVPLSVLLIGHLDTVFPAGSAAQIPFNIIDGLATGAGVLDMKSCLVAMGYALEALDALQVEKLPSLTVLLIGDEEIGSVTARELITEEGKRADYALVVEGARANGALVVERKGTGFLDLQAHGRAAHAGNEPEVGRSAIDEIAAKILKLRTLQDLASGTTVTVGQMGGGTARNVVAEDAWARVDLRFRTPVAQKELFASIEKVLAKPEHEGITLTYNLVMNRPPLTQVPGSEKLQEIAAKIMAELAIPFRTAIAGGASDGNFTAAVGTPTLDGLGPVGGMMCSPEEYLEIASLPERTAVQAMFLVRLAEDVGS